MKNNIYDTIFKRKSTRKYDMNPLDKDILDDVKKFCNNVNTLTNAMYKFEILDFEGVKSLTAIKAPHYLCLYSQKKGNYLMNSGYILQQISLYLSSIGLGNCWLGVAKPSPTISQMSLFQKFYMSPLTIDYPGMTRSSKYFQLKKDNLEFVIMIAFGKSNDTIYRNSISEFKRKPINEISSIVGFSDLVKAVSVAPSAVNSQPWFLSKSDNSIIVSRKKLNFVKSLIYNKMNKIDIGIALCHLKIACQNQNIKSKILFSPCEVNDGFEYMATLELLL